jgi:hypothetical protein
MAKLLRNRTRIQSRPQKFVPVIGRASVNKWEYEARIAKRFGFEQQLELPIPLPSPAQKEAAN